MICAADFLTFQMLVLIDVIVFSFIIANCLEKSGNLFSLKSG
jgi:hypothetical protein